MTGIPSHKPRRLVWLHCTAVMVLLFVSYCSGQSTTLSLPGATASPNQSVPLLDVIEVDAPLKGVPASSNCTVNLMKHTFAWSYGKPFVGDYTPPSCRFNRVILNFRATSAGRQYDRLAIMYLNDTEIWRTSTAEPTRTGIVWTYQKDVSNYISLWKKPQRLIFDLGNLINDRYDGSFETELKAEFFWDVVRNKPADLIYSVSKRLSQLNQSSAFLIPEDGKAIQSLTIPAEASRLVFSVSACGQAGEEFWFSNVPSSTTRTFGNASLPGFSPWREIQVLVDGNLVGIVWPFPIVFTGGVSPSLHLPIVGIDAYDLKEDEIDLTPILSMINDGQAHSYEIKVVGFADNGHGVTSLTPVGNNWIITGKLFVWVDSRPMISKPSLPQIYSPPPKISVQYETTKSPAGQNISLSYHVMVERELRIVANYSSNDTIQYHGWSQKRTFSNRGIVQNAGNNQDNRQMTTGEDVSTSGYSRQFEYPLKCISNATINPQAKSVTVSARLERSKIVKLYGQSAFPSGLDGYKQQSLDGSDGSILNTTQAGLASFESRGNITRGSGVTEQKYVFKGTRGLAQDFPKVPADRVTEVLFTRHVLAKNGKLVKDSPAMQDDQRIQSLVVSRLSWGQIPMTSVGPGDSEVLIGRRFQSVLSRATRAEPRSSQR